MAVLVEEESLHNKEGVFGDRAEGGRLLAEKLLRFTGEKTTVLAVPAGGVPVGRAIQKKLASDFDLLLVRKIQIPWNTEAGFGAINLDGDILINEPLLYALQLTEAEVTRQINKTKAVLQMRNEIFRKEKNFPTLKDRIVILADDGLASGYTMRAAIRFVKRREPATLIVAVPTGLLETVENLIPEVDCLACLNIRETYPFAVASAYRVWFDLTDEEVLRLLENERASG